jgi:O-antigen/teichoic acid export membrane protein
LGVNLSLLIIWRIPFNVNKEHLNALRTLLTYGAPLFLSNLLINGRARILNSILPLYSSNEIIGNLSATLNFSVLVTFVSNPIATALFPLLSKFSYEEGGEIQRIFRTAVKYTALIVYPITTIVILLSSQIVNIIFDTGYRYASFYIQLFMLTNYYAGFGQIGLNKLLNSQEKTRTTFNIKLIQFVIGLFIGLLLIPRIGATGFLITKAISPIPGLIYGLMWIKNEFRFTVDFKTSFKMLGICLVSFLICTFALRLTNFGDFIKLIFGTTLFFVVYGILIIKFNVLKRRDLENIIELLRIEWVSSVVFRLFDFIV